MNRYKFIDGPDEKGKPQHTHTLDGRELCGTSTVLGVLHKELTWWASGMAMSKLGWTPINDPKTKKKNPYDTRLAVARTKLNEIKDMSDSEYLALLDIGYKAHKEKLDTSAEAGTNMHYELEQYVKMCLLEADGVPMFPRELKHVAVQFFAEWSMENVERYVASEAHCYSEKMWTGGIVDLIFLDNKGQLALLDFKSAKEAYHTHFMQNAGYDLALTENGIFDKDGNLIRGLNRPISYYAVLPFGVDDPQVYFKTNVEQYKRSFQACVELYKLMNPEKMGDII